MINNRQHGYVTLISVMVVGAIGVAVMSSILLLGLGSARTGFAVEQSSQAKGLANACAEEALQRIRDAASFTGTGNMALGQGVCAYTVTSQGGANRTVNATGTVGSVVRKVTVVITAINPLIVVASWQETP